MDDCQGPTVAALRRSRRSDAISDANPHAGPKFMLPVSVPSRKSPLFVVTMLSPMKNPIVGTA